MDIFTGLWLLTRLLLMQLSLVYAGSSTAGLNQELHVHQIQRKRRDRTDCPCSCEKATVGQFLVRPKLFRINWNNPQEWQKPNSHKRGASTSPYPKSFQAFRICTAEAPGLPAVTLGHLHPDRGGRMSIPTIGWETAFLRSTQCSELVN